MEGFVYAMMMNLGFAAIGYIIVDSMSKGGRHG